MRTLLVFALVGFGAQLVDGALGMAYGVTSTSLLLAAAVNPATASASVHLAEVGTTLAAGASHWRFGNVDWKLVLRLGVPGAVGAFLGATVLSALSTENAAPYMAGVLLALGLYVLLKFSIRPPRVATARVSPHGARFLSPLGFVGGFVDASGGGGWGPVATPALLTAGKTAPRTVIGSVDTSEFIVAVAASAGFLVGIGREVLDPATIGGLLLGGILAAPLAAWLVSKIPAPVLGSLVGGIIVLTNTRTVLRALDVSTNWRATIYAFVIGLWSPLWRSRCPRSVAPRARWRASRRRPSRRTPRSDRGRLSGRRHLPRSHREAPQHRASHGIVVAQALGVRPRPGERPGHADVRVRPDREPSRVDVAGRVHERPVRRADADRAGVPQHGAVVVDQDVLRRGARPEQAGEQRVRRARRARLLQPGVDHHGGGDRLPRHGRTAGAEAPTIDP
jgi:uncharacterized protein